MAHFAKLNDQNIVESVIVVHNNELVEDGIESEDKGIEFCRSLFGVNTNWVQTSYNGNFRKNYAGKGFTYDLVRDAFIPPKPFTSWVLNEDTCVWECPVAYPDDGKRYSWDDSNLIWVLGEIPAPVVEVVVSPVIETVEEPAADTITIDLGSNGADSIIGGADSLPGGV